MKLIATTFIAAIIFIAAGCVVTHHPVTTHSGLQYQFFTKHKSPVHPQVGDIITYHLILMNHLDSVIFNTHLEFGPQQLTLEKSNFKGDLNEGLMMMSLNDSALFLIKTDSLYGSFMPHFAEPHQRMKFYISLVDFMSKAKWDEKLKNESLVQAEKDEKTLTEYFDKKQKHFSKTPSGMYWNITKPGTGEFAKPGDSVVVNYTGRLLDGTIFDSNTDHKFRHVEPFSFLLGNGNVIKGWDEGLQYFNKGAKGVIYIPSGLAYGKRASGLIPANGILIFDIELVDLKRK